jgi:RNA polymerase sigma factor (sigma-70 family)
MQRSRHAEALRGLVAEQYDLLVRYAASRLGDYGVPRWSADPEDIVQNVLLAVLKRDGPITFIRSYTYTCMRREVGVAADRYYKGRGYESLDADVRAEDEPAEPSFEEEATQRHVINEALAELPPQQRRAFLLTRELGMTQEQAAQAMGTATATVGVHMSRATRTLRTALAGVGMALVGWATASIVRGEREIIPAAGGGATPAVYTATMSALIVVGLIAGVVGMDRLVRTLRILLVMWSAPTGETLKAVRRLWQGLAPDGGDAASSVRAQIKGPPSSTHTRVVEPERSTKPRMVVRSGGIGGRLPVGKTRTGMGRRTQAEADKAREDAAKALNEGMRRARSRSGSSSVRGRRS